MLNVLDRRVGSEVWHEPIRSFRAHITYPNVVHPLCLQRRDRACPGICEAMEGRKQPAALKRWRVEKAKDGLALAVLGWLGYEAGRLFRAWKIA